MDALTALKEVYAYIQECRQSGETDLRDILQFISTKIKEVRDGNN